MSHKNKLFRRVAFALVATAGMAAFSYSAANATEMCESRFDDVEDDWGFTENGELRFCYNYVTGELLSGNGFGGYRVTWDYDPYYYETPGYYIYSAGAVDGIVVPMGVYLSQNFIICEAEHEPYSGNCWDVQIGVGGWAYEEWGYYSWNMQFSITSTKMPIYG